jgi:ribulose-phosphate 3-epimerase
MAVQIVPSVLPADLARLGDECRALESAGVDRIQWDVMDGGFVPNLTFGADLIAACRGHVDVPFEAHLMIEAPEPYLGQYAEAGCQWLIVHLESTKHPHRALMAVKELGVDSGLALSPGTPIEAADPLLELTDMLLIMTVNPGFGGQSYIASMERKVATARRLIAERGLDIEIEVDGGIGPETIAGAAGAGADIFVSGSALWKYPSFAQGVEDLRNRAEAAKAA